MRKSDVRDAGESGVYDLRRGDRGSLVLCDGLGFMYIDCCDSAVR